MSYDERIRDFLQVLRNEPADDRGNRDTIHSYPQATFLLMSSLASEAQPFLSRGTTNHSHRGVDDNEGRNTTNNSRTVQKSTTASQSFFMFLPKLDLLGDLKEMSHILALVGFEYNHSLTIGRNAADNHVKASQYPKRRDLLSNQTLQALCEYLALDYFLFDYEPPATCQELEIWTEYSRKLKEEWNVSSSAPL